MDGPTRFIQVMNDNSLVKYVPNNLWTSIPRTNPIFQIGNMGAPVSSFLQGSHGGTPGDPRSISFNFEGLEIVVMTSFLGFANIPPGPGTVNCKVDDELLTTNISQSPQNNWPICNGGNLTDGEHTLTVNISSPDILFDYILYTPSAPTNTLDPGLTDASTLIEASDSFTPISNTTMTDVPTAMPPASITSTGSSHSNRDLIIGIALGAGIFLLTVILFIFKYLDLNTFNFSLSFLGNCMV